FPPSFERIQSHGKITLMAKSVTRASPSNGCGFFKRADLNVQCHDQNSSRSTFKIPFNSSRRGRAAAFSVAVRKDHFSIFEMKFLSASQCDANANRRCG